MGDPKVEKLGLRVLPTDKDGGYALEYQETVTKVTEIILGREFYVKVPPRIDTQMYLGSAIGIINDIAKYEKQKSLIRELGKSMRMKEASLISKLKLTVKTHKSPRKVGHKNIHAADSYALKRIEYMGDDEIGK